MASLTELFNPTFLMFLGILLLAIALLVLYFESKFRDQNHKISSMLSLVSSLAEELNTNKMMINHLTMIGAGNNGISQNITTPYENKNLEEINSSELINVSDDEHDNDSDYDYDDSDVDEDEDNSNVDDDEDDSDDEKSTDYILEDNNVIQISEPDVKVFKINISENNEDLEEKLDNNSDNMDILDDLDDLASCNSESSEDNIEESNLENFLHLDNDNNNEELEKHIVNSFDFKSINISTLEDSKENIDFKKLSLNKLRNVVSDKGLSIDAYKLKKNDLLKLLGVE